MGFSNIHHIQGSPYPKFRYFRYKYGEIRRILPLLKSKVRYNKSGYTTLPAESHLDDAIMTYPCSELKEGIDIKVTRFGLARRPATGWQPSLEGRG